MTIYCKDILNLINCLWRCIDAGLAGRVRYWYNAESPKQGNKRFNSITKTIHFAPLGILFNIYLCPHPLPLAPHPLFLNSNYSSLILNHRVITVIEVQRIVVLGSTALFTMVWQLPIHDYRDEGWENFLFVGTE